MKKLLARCNCIHASPNTDSIFTSYTNTISFSWAALCPYCNQVTWWTNPVWTHVGLSKNGSPSYSAVSRGRKRVDPHGILEPFGSVHPVETLLAYVFSSGSNQLPNAAPRGCGCWPRAITYFRYSVHECARVSRQPIYGLHGSE